MPIVTIAREYGSGGFEYGRTLAERLGADFVDTKLVEEVARRMRCAEETVAHWDERSEGLILRLLRAMQTANPESVAPGSFAHLDPEIPSPERIAATVREVMMEEARGENAVFLGRGGAFVLQAHPGALHVRLVAPRTERAARIAARLSLGSTEALDRVDEADRERARFIRHHFGVDWRDAGNYDVVFNTTRLGIPAAVEATVALLAGRAA